MTEYSGLDEEENVSLDDTEYESPSKTSYTESSVCSSVDHKKKKHLIKSDIGPDIFEDKKANKMISREQPPDSVKEDHDAFFDSEIPTLAEEKILSSVIDLREKNILKKGKKLVSEAKIETLDKIPKESNLILQRFQVPKMTKFKSQLHVYKAACIKDVENEQFSRLASKTNVTGSLNNDTNEQESNLLKTKVSSSKKKHPSQLATANEEKITMAQRINDLDEISSFSVDKLRTEDIFFVKECEEAHVIDEKSQAESKISQLSAAKAIKHAPLDSSEQPKLLKYLYGLPQLKKHDKMKYEIHKEQSKTSFTIPERRDISEKSKHAKHIDPSEEGKEIAQEKDRQGIKEFPDVIMQDTEEQNLSNRYSELEDETGEKRTIDKDDLDTFLTEYKAENDFKDKRKLEVTAKTSIIPEEKKLENERCRRESVYSAEKETNIVTSKEKNDEDDFVTSDYVIKKKDMKHSDEQVSEETLSDVPEMKLIYDIETKRTLKDRTTESDPAENEYTEESQTQWESFSAKGRNLDSTVIPKSFDYESDKVKQDATMNEIHFEDIKEKSQSAEANIPGKSRYDSGESRETTTAKLPLLNQQIPDKIPEQKLHYFIVHNAIDQGLKCLNYHEIISNDEEILMPMAQNNIIRNDMTCSLNEVQQIISSEQLKQLHFLYGEVKHEHSLFHQTFFKGGKNFLGNVAYFDKALSNVRLSKKSFKNKKLSLEQSKLKKIARRLYNEGLTKTEKNGLIPPSDVTIREASDVSDKVYAFSPTHVVSNIRKTSLKEALAQTHSKWMPDTSNETLRHQFAITSALTDVFDNNQEIKEKSSVRLEKKSKGIAMHISADKVDLPDSQTPMTSDSEYSVCDEEDEENYLWNYQILQDADDERDLKSEHENEVKFPLFNLENREDVLQSVANFIYPQRLSFFEIKYGDDPFGYLRTFLTLDTKKFIIIPQHTQRNDMEKVPDYLAFKKNFESVVGEEELDSSNKTAISICAESDKEIISEISAESIQFPELKDADQSLLSSDDMSPLISLLLPIEFVSYIDKSARKQNIKKDSKSEFDKIAPIETTSLVPISINYKPISPADLSRKCSEPSQFILECSDTDAESETLDSGSAVYMQKPLLGVPTQSSEITVALANDILENSSSDSATLNIDNIDPVTVNTNFSDSLVSAEFDRNKFKMVFSKYFSDILKKCMISKSYHFMTEIQEDISERNDTEADVPALPNERSSKQIRYLINSFDDEASDYISEQMSEKPLPTTSQKGLSDYDQKEGNYSEKLAKFTPSDDDVKEKIKKISNEKYKAPILPKGSFGIIKQVWKLEKKDGLSKDIDKSDKSYSDSNASDTAIICTAGTLFESSVQGNYLEEISVIEEAIEERKDKHLKHLVPKIFHPCSDSGTTSPLQKTKAVKVFDYIRNPLSELLKQPIKITDIFITRDVSLSKLPAYAESQSCDMYFQASPVAGCEQFSNEFEDRSIQYSQLEANVMEYEDVDIRRPDVLRTGTLRPAVEHQMASFPANILQARMNIAEIYTMAEGKIQLLEKYFEENTVKLRRLEMRELCVVDLVENENDLEREE